MRLQNVILQTVVCLVLGIVAVPQLFAQEASANRMTPELLWKLGRLGETVPSPDGTQLAYTVRRYELSENKGRSELHIYTIAESTDETVLQDWSSIGSLSWQETKSGPRLMFEGTQPAPQEETESGKANADDGDDGDERDVDSNQESTEPTNQAWSMDPTNSELTQLTSVKDGISNLKVAPGGEKLAFTLDIKMDKEANELYPDLPKVDARIIDHLMYRHWNAWHDYKYSHLHVATIGEDGVAGEPVDLMEGIKADCPVPPFGGTEQFAWSQNGQEIAFTMKNVDDWAESTNSDVYLIPVDRSSEPRNISASGEGYDNNPSYSPDGKYIAYNSMERPGFESDRNRIMLFDRTTGASKELTVGLDQNANNPTWMPDSTALVFESERMGTDQLFKIEVENGSTVPASQGQCNWHLFGFLPDGKTAITSKTTMLRPAEIHFLSMADKSDQTISAINDEIFADLEMPTIEERFVEATDGKKIQCWVIFPPDFDRNSEKQWPLLTYCQGGPQGQIGQWFSYRWNFHLMAANGYVVIAPNRRGLPGFGRQWNDEISKDWGGQAMKDILSATDSMLEEPNIDRSRTAAIGASFGGYTVYWLMGNSEDRFSAMIAHCGVYNLESMYGATEELFFVNWDLGGPFWKSADILASYQKFSPHRFVGKWHTPLLVIHGEKDFRVPVTQGMEAFTAAQVQDVPSRFLYFPNEGHWVMQPQNGVLWHRVFFDWLDRYCKNPTSPKANSVKE